MAQTTIQALLWGAVSIAFLHTLMGVDHYLPFVVIGKARRWSLWRTLGLVLLCGVGHVLGSVVLGFLGILLGVALGKLTWLESVRGSFAAWSLITFGLVYALWSWIKLRQGRVHDHGDGVFHRHDEDESKIFAEDANTTTRWTFFIIFVLGPCEALIPFLMVPAYEHHWWVVFLVTLLFSIVTIATMLLAVSVGYMGMRFFSFRSLHRYADTIAGLTIAGSGLAIKVLGI
ncbi:MAG: hypothetical protein H6727_10485 [Myxococcales bacterium]|nr:hypothetical protein [Myxococcales bacterium]